MSGANLIDRDVFQYQVHGAAEEMSIALRSSAYSPIIWDMFDYACGLFTPDAEIIAQAETIPAQLGVMSTAIQRMFRHIPRGDWKPGDIIICNDPYEGCAHTMDVCLFSPVFHDGRLIALTSTIAHHIDIGGRMPGATVTDNTEVFAEGLIIPPMKLVEAGRLNETLIRIIEGNVRIPSAFKGDLRSQIGSCRTGERRLLEMVRRYGTERFTTLTRECLDYAERYMRRSIKAAPDGTAEAHILIEDDVTSDTPVRLVARTTISGDTVEVDLSDSSDQRPFALNCPVASTIAMVQFAVTCVFAPTLSHNHGCTLPIRVTTRKGSILDPVRPAAVGSRHQMQQAVADVVLRALASLKPDSAAAGSHISDPMITISGIDSRPECRDENGKGSYYVIADGLGGGMGAAPGTDGLDAVDTHGGNCALISAEILETVSPVRVVRTEVVRGSGGAGQFRGGLAMLRDYELLAGTATLTGVMQKCRADTAPWGVNGGGAGGRAAFILNPGQPTERRLTSKILGEAMRKGDVLRVVSAGGGGWGNPARRDPAAADRDRREGYV